MTPYASTDDLAAWLGADAPANATLLLRTASYAVREATETAYYAADPVTGLPTATATLAAFRDATCAQAAALHAIDIDPTAGGALEVGVQTSIGIGSARITYADAAEAVAAKQQILGGLCLEAARILRQANIVLGVPWVVG